MDRDSGYRFREGDLVICKPEEEKRSPDNIDFEIYARVVSADRGRNAVVLDRYQKQGRLHYNVRELPLEEMERGGYYQPMSSGEVREFAEGLRSCRGHDSGDGRRVYEETLRMAGEAALRAQARAQAERMLRIDREYAPLYGSDQICLTYPLRFPTVTFILSMTDELYRAAEEARREGYSGPPENYTGRDGSDYICSIGVNGMKEGEGTADRSIEAWDSVSETVYCVSLPDDAAKEAYGILDRQASELFGKGCGEMLAESRADMEKRFAYEKEERFTGEDIEESEDIGL